VQGPYTPPASAISSSPGQPQSLQRLLFSFEGRIPRRSFWGVTLCSQLVILLLLSGVVVINSAGLTFLVIVLLYIPTIWIQLAVSVKRWHDRDKSGWWILISLVPLIGAIWALIENGLLRGTPGANSYGPDPT